MFANDVGINGSLEKQLLKSQKSALNAKALTGIRREREVNKMKENLFLNGNIASTGLTKGVAVIVKKLDDLKKVEIGNIIITEKTIPAMITAMDKCNGIVTDFGGVTSHAAIVSRELGVPCLVGCKNATKTFSDGDLVILDAINGII